MIDLYKLTVGDKVCVRDATMFPKAALDDDGMLIVKSVTPWSNNTRFNVDFQNGAFPLVYEKSGNCPGLSKADIITLFDSFDRIVPACAKDVDLYPSGSSSIDDPVALVQETMDTFDKSVEEQRAYKSQELIDLTVLKVGDKVRILDATKYCSSLTRDNQFLVTEVVRGIAHIGIELDYQSNSVHIPLGGKCIDREHMDIVEIIPMTSDEAISLVREAMYEVPLYSGTITGRYVPVAKNMAEEVVFSHDLYTSQGVELLLIDLKKKARMIHTDYIENKRTWTFRDKSTVIQCLISNEFNTHATEDVCDTENVLGEYENIRSGSKIEHAVAYGLDIMYEHSSVIYCGTTTPIPGN